MQRLMGRWWARVITFCIVANRAFRCFCGLGCLRFCCRSGRGRVFRCCCGLRCLVVQARQGCAESTDAFWALRFRKKFAKSNIPKRFVNQRFAARTFTMLSQTLCRLRIFKAKAAKKREVLRSRRDLDGEDRRTTGEACAVLLAATRGGAPEPAAVRGDAGPDRAVADTYGIDRRWPAQAAESVYKGLGKEKCCKSGGISGQFRRCSCGSQTVGGCSG
jgi:hypothetical protein